MCNNKQNQKPEELPEWLQPQDGIEPGIDISVEEVEKVTQYLKDKLGIDPTM